MATLKRFVVDIVNWQSALGHIVRVKVNFIQMCSSFLGFLDQQTDR